MGETGVHVNVTIAVLGMLRWHYRPHSRVAVLANMFLYYEEGDPRKVVCPDVFVTLNVPRHTMRRTFKTWLEGKGPDAIIEITSKKTRTAEEKLEARAKTDRLRREIEDLRHRLAEGQG
jgi:hypothetical protein